MGIYDQLGEIKITTHTDRFAFINKQKTIKIPYGEILYIEQFNNQLLIKKIGMAQNLLVIAGKVKDIPAALDDRFYRCHSYLIINMAKAVSMTGGKVIFDNGEEKHLGRDAYVKTRKAFNDYLTETK